MLWEVGVGRWLRVEGRGSSQESQMREVFEMIGKKGEGRRKSDVGDWDKVGWGEGG